jgi:hypothetical protein
MRRTTIYLDPELEVLLKLEMLRQKRPMADIVREALHAYITSEPRQAPPGAGAFASGRTDTAQDVDDMLRRTGFGTGGGALAATNKSKASPRKKR